MRLWLLYIAFFQMVYALDKKEVMHMVKTLSEYTQKSTTVEKNIQNPFVTTKLGKEVLLNSTQKEGSVKNRSQIKKDQHSVTQKTALFNIPNQSKSLELQAIMNTKAYINKKWLREGEVILLYTVLEIRRDFVRLQKNDEELILFIAPKKQLVM